MAKTLTQQSKGIILSLLNRKIESLQSDVDRRNKYLKQGLLKKEDVDPMNEKVSLQIQILETTISEIMNLDTEKAQKQPQKA